MATSQINTLADLLNSLRAEPVQLRQYRADLAHLVGLCDRYLADLQLQAEASTIAETRNGLAARADATARAQLTRTGIISPEAADRAGIHDHPTLDAPLPQGLSEAWSEQARAWEKQLREARTGMFGPVHDRDLTPIVSTPNGEKSIVSTPQDTSTILSPPGTADVYSRDGIFDTSRKPVHDRIILSLINKHQPAVKPVATIITGTAAERLTWHLEATIPADHVLIDPKTLQQQLPEWEDAVRTGRPDETLKEAQIVAGAALYEAARRKLNVLVQADHPGHVNLPGYTHVRAHGFQTRARELQEAIRTRIPALTVEARDMLLEAVDRIDGRVYDMTGPDPVLVRDGDTIHRTDLWDAIHS